MKYLSILFGIILFSNCKGFTSEPNPSQLVGVYKVKVDPIVVQAKLDSAFSKVKSGMYTSKQEIEASIKESAEKLKESGKDTSLSQIKGAPELMEGIGEGITGISQGITKLLESISSLSTGATMHNALKDIINTSLQNVTVEFLQDGKLKINTDLPDLIISNTNNLTWKLEHSNLIILQDNGKTVAHTFTIKQLDNNTWNIKNEDIEIQLIKHLKG